MIQVPHKDIERKKKSIAMIEDNKKVRDSVIKYLGFHEDMEVVHSFGSAESYFDHIKEFQDFKIDILLLDIGLPGITGLEALPKILKHQPDLDVIMLTTYEEEKKILTAMALGAVAYVSKRASLENILEAIRVVSLGGSYMSPMVAREMFNLMMRDSNKKKTFLHPGKKKYWSFSWIENLIAKLLTFFLFPSKL